MTKLIVERPLGKFDLSNECGFDPMAAFNDYDSAARRVLNFTNTE